MATKNVYAPRQLARFIAAGILLSMISFYLLHFCGTWESGNYRPDAETTSSVLVYNKCAVLGDTHILRPATTSSSNNQSIDEVKFAGSFMNFFDGHILIMIVLALVLALLMFVIKKAAAGI
jgi:uncharacterized protein (DUF2062 family)